MINPRYDAHIRDLVDELAVYGFVQIKKDLLVKGWHQQERLSKTMWRNLVERFQEHMKPSAYKVFEWGDTLIIVEKTCMNELSERIA